MPDSSGSGSRPSDAWLTAGPDSARPPATAAVALMNSRRFSTRSARVLSITQLFSGISRREPRMPPPSGQSLQSGRPAWWCPSSCSALRVVAAPGGPLSYVAATTRELESLATAVGVSQQRLQCRGGISPRSGTAGPTDGAPIRRRRRPVLRRTPGRRLRRSRTTAWPRRPASPTCCAPTRLSPVPRTTG